MIVLYKFVLYKGVKSLSDEQERVGERTPELFEFTRCIGIFISSLMISAYGVYVA